MTWNAVCSKLLINNIVSCTRKGNILWLNSFLRVLRVLILVSSTHLMMKTISFHNTIKSTHLILMCGFLFTYTQFRLCVLLHNNNTTLVMLVHRGFVQVNLLHPTYQISYMLDGRFSYVILFNCRFHLFE